jgi:hypothetical protein
MEVEATSLGHAAFAHQDYTTPHDYTTPQAPSPSPLNSPWPEPDTSLDLPEEGATRTEEEEEEAGASQQGKRNQEEVAQQSPKDAVPPTADNQTLDTPSHSLPDPSQIPSRPPSRTLSLAQSLFPEDFEDEPKDDKATAQAEQVQPEAQVPTQTLAEQQTQSPTQTEQPQVATQSLPDRLPLPLHEPVGPLGQSGNPLDQSIDPLDQSVDPLDQSQPLPSQTSPKDYSELESAVADLNLPTNSLFPAHLALASYEAEAAAPVQDAVQNDPMQAFAKLQFPDGDFYINTYAVELGRDLNAAKFERKAGRKGKIKLNRDVQMEQDAEMNVNEDGQNAVRSNVSESGGIVGVNIDYDSEENEEAKRRKRAKQFKSNNSSHSVDPTSLLTVPYDPSLDWQPQQDKPFEYECPFIPIHPQAGQSFKNISRKHVRIEYNLQKSHWEMLVNGRNGTFHDDAHLDKGSLVKLHHGSEILIQGITIIFKLPDNARQEEEEEEPAHIFSDTDSSLSDLGSIASVTFGQDDEEDISSEDEPLSLKRPARKKERNRKIVKLKLNLKRNFPAVAGLPVEKEEKKEKDKEKKDKEKKADREKTKEKEQEKAKLPEKVKTKDKDKEKEKEKERRPSKSGKQSVKTDKSVRTGLAEKAPRVPKVADKAVKVDKVDVPDKTASLDKVEKPKAIEVVEKTIVAPQQPQQDIPQLQQQQQQQSEVSEQTAGDAREPASSSTEMPPPSHSADIQMSVEADQFEALQQLQIGMSQTPPAIPADLPPGSILAGLAPEEIPQKRKGPGRPPKNGVMSKRDEAIIKRKTKELQKMGREVPPLAELLALARAEGGSTTKKDSKSEDAREGEGMSQSVEIDPALMALQEHNNATPSAEVKTERGNPAAQPTPDKDANKAKRIVKSPSPQKPESDYTEEELKKPTQTYVVLIHEALSKAPAGVMDLQQIYDAMQKMYPWFKYRSTTHGWQSSVRHNLISSEAFEEAGKIGKGRLWKINPTVSIDKEKKRKAPTPPPDNRPQQQYPYYPNNQYPYGPPGAPAYGAYARPSPYGTPYGPPTVQNVARPPVPTPQQKPGTYYSPYASTTPGTAAHGSPYGPPSRAPYAPYPQPPRPPGSVYGQPNQPPQAQPGQPQGPTQPGQALPLPQGQQPSPSGQAPPPGQAYQPNGPQAGAQNGQPHYSARGQPPPRPVMAPGQAQGQLPPPPQNQSGITSEKMIDNIMDYHKRYLSTFQGPEQEKHRAIFRKATNRHIHRGQDHGPFESEEEEKLYKTILNIISSTQAETASAQPQQNGQRPTPDGQPQGQAYAGASQRAAVTNSQPSTPGPYSQQPGQAGPQQQVSNGQILQAAMAGQSNGGPHPVQKSSGSSSEEALAEALKTAMPHAHYSRLGAPNGPYHPAPPTHQGIAPRPGPYAQPGQPYVPHQRIQPAAGQQHGPQARPNAAVGPPVQQPHAPRPTFTAPSQPPPALSTSMPQGQAPASGAPRPVAPAPSQAVQKSPATSQASQPVSAAQAPPAIQPSPTPTASQPPTPAPPVQTQVPEPAPPAPSATTSMPVAAPASLAPAASISTPTRAPVPVVPTRPADPNAHGGLKRPIEIDDDGDHEAKKQKTDGET